MDSTTESVDRATDEHSLDRFAFGDNWRAFLKTLDQQRIEVATESLKQLHPESLAGKRFLDLGSGSGFFCLAANLSGADVVSVDYDQQSVACTQELKRSFGGNAGDWTILRGSVLDTSFLQSLGQFDVVYSWGVLHHTGSMWRAIENAVGRVGQGGRLILALYNDQGAASRRWLRIKQAYHRLPKFLRPPWVLVIASVYEVKFSLARLKNGKSPLPFEDWRAKKRDRGMSAWHDWVDWVGGLPFEVASPHAVDEFVGKLGFKPELVNKIGNGWGCNEFVFRRTGVRSDEQS